MPAWSVIIDDGEILTLDENIRIKPKASKKVDGEGNVEAVNFSLEVEVTVRSDDPDAVAGTVIQDYLNQVWQRHEACTVVLERDGTEYLRLEPEGAFHGPFVTEFETLDSNEGGAGESRWKCRFTIEALMKGVQTSGDEPVYELHSSIATTKKDGKVIRRVWRIDAQSTSTEAAESIVKAFGPGSSKSITEEIEPHFRDARATGVWVWERETKSGVLSHRCHISSPGGGQGWVPMTRAGGRNPVLFEKQRTAMRIQVNGTIISLNKDMVAPNPHFTESPTMRRATEEEQCLGDVEIFDEKEGKYKLDYDEVWYYTGPNVPPTPKHHGHNVIEEASAPA